MGRANNGADQMLEEKPVQAGNSGYGNFFQQKMADIDRISEGLGSRAGIDGSEVSDILKKGGLALLAGSLLLGPVGMIGAFGYVGYRATKAWQGRGQDASDPLVDASGNPAADKPLDTSKSIGKTLAKAGLGGLALGGAVSLALSGPLFPIALTATLATMGTCAVSNWKKLAEAKDLPQPEEVAPSPAPEEARPDPSDQLFDSLRSTDGGQQVLEGTWGAIYNSGGLKQGPEGCISAIQKEVGCGEGEAIALYQATIAGLRRGEVDERVIEGAPKEAASEPSPETKQEEKASKKSREHETSSRYQTGPKEAKRNPTGKCRAPTARGWCGHPAGWGTDHKGKGRCIHHEGQRPVPVEEIASRQETSQRPKKKEKSSLKMAQGAWNAAWKKGEDFTPEFIAKHLGVSRDKARGMYEELRAAAPDLFKEQPSAPKRDLSVDHKKQEMLYKEKPSATEEQKTRMQEACAAGDTEAAISLFDEAYFSPEERLGAIRASYQQAYRKPENTKSKQEAIAAVYRKAGLEDIARKVESSSQEQIAASCDKALEQYIDNNPWEYWSTKPLKKEMVSASANSGIGDLAQSSLVPEDVARALSPADYKEFKALVSDHGISPGSAIKFLFAPLSQTTGTISKSIVRAKSQEERSGILMKRFREGVEKRMAAKAKK